MISLLGWGWSPGLAVIALSPSLPQGRAGLGQGLQVDKQGEHDFLQWGFDLPNVTRQAGDRCQAQVIPGSHRRALSRYSHGEHLGRLGPGLVPIIIRFWKTWWVKCI